MSLNTGFLADRHCIPANLTFRCVLGREKDVNNSVSTGTDCACDPVVCDDHWGSHCLCFSQELGTVKAADFARIGCVGTAGCIGWRVELSGGLGRDRPSPTTRTLHMAWPVV